MQSGLRDSNAKNTGSHSQPADADQGSLGEEGEDEFLDTSRRETQRIASQAVSEATNNALIAQLHRSETSRSTTLQAISDATTNAVNSHMQKRGDASRFAATHAITNATNDALASQLRRSETSRLLTEQAIADATRNASKSHIQQKEQASRMTATQAIADATNNALHAQIERSKTSRFATEQVITDATNNALKAQLQRVETLRLERAETFHQAAAQAISNVTADALKSHHDRNQTSRASAEKAIADATSKVVDKNMQHQDTTNERIAEASRLAEGEVVSGSMKRSDNQGQRIEFPSELSAQADVRLKDNSSDSLVSSKSRDLTKFDSFRFSPSFPQSDDSNETRIRNMLQHPNKSRLGSGSREESQVDETDRGHSEMSINSKRQGSLGSLDLREETAFPVSNRSHDSMKRRNTFKAPEEDRYILEMLASKRDSIHRSMSSIRSQKLLQGSRRSLASSSSPGRDSVGEALIDSLLAKDANELNMTDLKLLEAELTQWQVRTDDMRSKLEQHKQYHQVKHSEELRTELNHIDVKVEKEREERQRLEAKLQELREREAIYAIADDRVEEELQGMELQHQLEHIAMLRIKADRLREEREALEDSERVRKVEIDAISEENSRRSISGEATLQRLLTKVDELRKELSHPEYKKDTGFTKELHSSFAIEGHEITSATREYGRFARMFDKVAQVREERWESKLKELETELGDLCDERARLAKEEEDLRDRRDHHKRLVRQGLDYLVELELGNAPPPEYVLKNLHNNNNHNHEEDAAAGDRASSNEPSQSGEDNNDTQAFDVFNFDELADSVEAHMEIAQSRIASYSANLKLLDKEREWTATSSILAPHEQKPYNGFLGASSYQKDRLASFHLVRGVLLDVVDNFLETYTPIDQTQLRSEAVAAIEKWRASGHFLERRIQAEIEEDAVRLVADEVVSTTLDSVLRGIYGEVQTALLLSQKIADKLVLGSVFSLWQGDGPVPDNVKDQVTSTFTELQHRRDVRDIAQREQSRKPITSLSLRLEKAMLPQEVSVFYSTHAAYSEASMARIREELQKKRAQEEAYEDEINERRLDLDMEAEEAAHMIEEPDASQESDDEEDDSSTSIQFALAHVLEPEKVQLKAPEFRLLEKAFWNNISFRSKHIKVSHSLGKPSAIAGSSGGEYMAIGTTYGYVLVYDVRPDKALLLRKFIGKTGQGAILQLVWSMDVGSLLLALEEGGTVRLLSTSTASQPSKGRAWAKSFKPVPLEEVLVLSWRDFDRPVQEDLFAEANDIQHYKAKIQANQRRAKRKRKGTVEVSESDLQPVYVAFHTAHTLFGVQLSILIALQNGDIVKYNSDYNKVYGDRSVYCPSHAHVEPPNPRDDSLIPGQPRGKGELFGSTIRREFFQDHKNVPIFIGFVNRCSEVMYSIDSKMRMRQWPYEPSQFSGFGWFVPAQRYSLDLRAVAYSSDKTFPVEKLFPPEGVEIPTGTIAGGGGKPPLSEDEILKDDQNFVTLAREEERLIATLSLQDRPWLVREAGQNQRIMQIFAPEEAAFDKSSPHHVLIHSKGGILVQHMVSYFAPKVSEGVLEDVTLSHSGSEIFFLVRYTATSEKPATVRIFVFDTATATLEPTAVEILMEGKIRPRLVVSPLLNELDSDYVYVLMNSNVYVVSLTSGLFATQRLSPLGQNAEPGVSLTDMVLFRDHEHLACIGANSDTIYLFAIENLGSEDDQKRDKDASNDSQSISKYRPRKQYSPRECTV